MKVYVIFLDFVLHVTRKICPLLWFLFSFSVVTFAPCEYIFYILRIVTVFFFLKLFLKMCKCQTQAAWTRLCQGWGGAESEKTLEGWTVGERRECWGVSRKLSLVEPVGAPLSLGGPPLYSPWGISGGRENQGETPAHVMFFIVSNGMRTNHAITRGMFAKN